MKEKRLKTKLSERAETGDPNKPHSVTDNIPHTFPAALHGGTREACTAVRDH